MTKDRIISAIIYGGIFILFMILGWFRLSLLSILWAILAILMAKELSNLLDIEKTNPSRWIIVFQTFAFVLPLFSPRSWIRVAGNGLFRPTEQVLSLESSYRLLIAFLAWQILAALLHVMAAHLNKYPYGVTGAFKYAAMGTYVALPLFAGNQILFTVPYGWTWLVLVLVTPWVSDSLAWAVGKTYGSRKIFPVLSPKKSLEGCIAGLLGTGLFYVIIYFVILYEVALPFYYIFGYFVLGVFASFFCQLGDLFESGLKREMGVKDSGTLIPGHGGILDRFDSSLFLLSFFFIILSFY